MVKLSEVYMCKSPLENFHMVSNLVHTDEVMVFVNRIQMFITFCLENCMYERHDKIQQLFNLKINLGRR